MRHSLCSVCLLLLCAVAPLASQSPNPVAAKANLLAHYVILGSSGSGPVAHARAIIEPGYTCPSLAGGGADTVMTTRDNPHHFPVVVCEAVMELGQARRLKLADVSVRLPVTGSDPTTIHVFGDTGCKSKTCPPGTLAEPFATLAKAAAASAPDLVLHMGDANYRGTPSHVMFTVAEPTPGGSASYTQTPQYTYDAGDGSEVGQGCGQTADTLFYSLNEANSNYADNWAAWRDDFFRPAAELLAAAPWIITRGNHELCSRAGPGWFYFLDPSSKLTGGQLGCPTPNRQAPPIENVTLAEPYAVDLGTLNVVVIDTANACDSFINPTFQARYDAQYAGLPELAPDGRTTWLAHHRPLWGVTEYSSTESTSCRTDPEAAGGGEASWGCINQTMQRAVANALGGELPAGVELVLSGHMHRFQTVTFPGTKRPPQIVIGNSGVELDGSDPLGDFQTPVDAVEAAVLSTGSQVEVESTGSSAPAFGYLEITYNGDGTWSGVIQDASATPTFELATCGEPWEGRRVCELAEGVSAQ